MIIPLIALLCVAGCTSPENTRMRGGGRGADTGNRGDIVRMHEGANPFEDTPKLIPTKNAPLEGARHADQLSRNDRKR